MKQYESVVQKNNIELIVPISDGQSFVLSFPAPPCKKAKSITISLYFGNCWMYRTDFYPSASRSSCYDTNAGRRLYGWFEDNSANFVFRIDKATSPYFNTFINNHFIREDHSTTMIINHENRVDAVGVAINSTEAVTITLTVFEYAEYGNVETFSNAFRNLGSSDFVTGEEGLVLKEREKESSADGADDSKSLSVANMSPQDTNWMQYSSTVVWPIAIELEAINLKTSLQQKHDTLMREWVIGHGDNISLNTHDYFIHSHGVAWPKALASVNSEKATKIRERHAQLFKNLPRTEVKES